MVGRPVAAILPSSALALCGVQFAKACELDPKAASGRAGRAANPLLVARSADKVRGCLPHHVSLLNWPSILRAPANPFIVCCFLFILPLIDGHIYVAWPPYNSPYLCACFHTSDQAAVDERFLYADQRLLPFSRVIEQVSFPKSSVAAR